MTALAGTAAAESFSGKWEGPCTYYTLNIYGEQTYKVTGTCTLQISQSGDSVSDGVLDIRLTKWQGLPISEGVHVPPTAVNSQIRSGSVKGSTITFRTLNDEWTFTKEGDKLVGGCENTDDYSYLGISSDAKAFTLTFVGGFSESSIPVAIVAVAAAAVGLGVSLLPAPPVPKTVQYQRPFNPAPGQAPTAPQYQGPYQPQPFNPAASQAPIAPQYQEPSVTRTTEVPAGPPVAGTSLGGVGLTSPVLTDQNGIPFPPRRYPSQYPPMCPVPGHGPCQAMFPFQNQQEPGSWFCPKCQPGPNKGYPWGKNLQ